MEVRKMDKRFWVGLALALIGAGMMFFGIGNLSFRIIIGIIGLILIAISKKKKVKLRSSSHD